MDSNKNRGFGGATFILFLVTLFAVFWFTNQAQNRDREFTYREYQEALDNGCGYDAPGSFAAWLSKQTPMHAYVMPGKRYDIGDINSYEYVKSVFSK